MPANTTLERRRPKNRKGQILAAARTRIVQAGYRNVSMAQIADDVGITAGGLYRHFTNKAVLVAAVIDQSFDRVVPAFDDSTSLDDALAASCEHVARHRDVGALWWRELAHVPPERYDDLRERLYELNERCTALVLGARPDLSVDAAGELAWGVHAVLASTSWHATKIDVDEFAALLRSACQALLDADLPRPRPVTRPAEQLTVVSRHERLLQYATSIFDERGFEATLDEIGAAAGVTGPSLYSHFPSKNDIFQAAIDRSTSALWLLLHSVLRDADGAPDALTRLLRGYVTLAVDKAIMTAVLQMEQSTLPEFVRTRQREYLLEWTTLLRATRPELTETQARVLVHTALGVVHTVNRVDELRERGDLRPVLAAMALAVLLETDVESIASA